MQQSTVQAVLAGGFDGVSRIQLEHHRCREFRWISLVQLPLYLLVWAIAVVLAIFVIVALILAGELNGDEFDLEDFGWLLPRFFRYWHEVHVVLLGADGGELARGRSTVCSDAERDALVVATLDAAARTGTLVVQSLTGHGLGEVAGVYYGRRPLLTPPSGNDPKVGAAVLADAEIDVSLDDATRQVVVRERAQPVNRLIQLLLLPFRSALALVRVFDPAAREEYVGEWLTFIYGYRESTVVVLTSEGVLSVRLERGQRTTTMLSVGAGDLLAIGFGPQLGVGRKVRRRSPRLCFATRQGITTWPRSLSSSVGAALRDVLCAHAVQQWHGVATVALQATRCPYCGTTYQLDVGASCPSCGGRAQALATAEAR